MLMTRALGMILTTSKRVTRTPTLTTSMMASKSLRKCPRLQPPLRHRHRLYSHYPSYVNALATMITSTRPVLIPTLQPIPDFDAMGMEDILATTEPYLNALFSTAAEADDITITPPPKDNPIFLTPRSASLWSQLVAPPPLQPPDWIRSRIRRLFLVSLGVPVDLDEILPASKQKKLVLPSVHSPRTSSDSRRSQSKTPTRLGTPQQGQDGTGNSNKTNNNGDAPRTGTKRKAPPPAFDLVSAKQLCSTTDEALGGMTDGELRAHVARLEAMEGTARGVLDYWQQRTDEQVGEREAFEGVIENLVKHARKTRK